MSVSIRVWLALILVPGLALVACDSPGGEQVPYQPVPDTSQPQPDVTPDVTGTPHTPVTPDVAGDPDVTPTPPPDTTSPDMTPTPDVPPTPDAQDPDTADDGGPGLPDTTVDPDVNTAPPDASLSTQPLGGVCAEDDDCDTGACNALHPGGYCTVWCSSHDDCSDGARCYADTAGAGKMCWKSCATDDDCRIDQFCAPGAGICTPKCTPGSCSSGYVCDEDSGQCYPPGQVTCEPTDEVCDGADNDCDKVVDEGCGPGVSDSPSVLVNDLGLVQVGGGGLSKNLSFDLSTAAGSFTILVLDAEGSDDLIALWDLASPSGEAMIKASDPLNAPIRSFPDPGAVTVQVPNTPLVDPEPGSWRFHVYREGPESHVWVYVIQSLRKDPKTSALDVNFWFVGTPGLDAATAPGSQKFQSLVATFEEVLNAHGMYVGSKEYHDVPSPAAQKYTFVDVSGDSWAVGEDRELVALSETLPTTNKGVNLFFVQGFNGYGLLGKAGGIPGPPLEHGTWNSGVIVSLADYYGYQPNYGIPITAETMAHELGHQLGLFHTSEQTGQQHDPIPDTPECSYDQNGNGMVEGWECEGAGAENLMFWTVTLSAGMSSGQKYVIHRNASTYEE